MMRALCAGIALLSLAATNASAWTLVCAFDPSNTANMLIVGNSDTPPDRRCQISCLLQEVGPNPRNTPLNMSLPLPNGTSNQTLANWPAYSGNTYASIVSQSASCDPP
jgi:hypothetical protein